MRNSRWNVWRRGPGALVALCVIAVVAAARAQSFSLDDNPFAPSASQPSSFIGYGAENPFGIPGGAYPPGFTPSPTVFFVGGTFDGAIVSPSPAPGVALAALQHAGPNGYWVASLSSNKTALTPAAAPLLGMEFSVDRLSVGLAGTAVDIEATASQAPGDIFTSTLNFVHPGAFAGVLAPIGAPVPTFAGVLPAVGPGLAGNTLTYNQGLPAPGIPGFGLLTGAGGPPGAVYAPGLAAPPLGSSTHDNVDGFDEAVFDAGVDGLFDTNCYFTIYPNEAVLIGGISSADVFLAPAGSPGGLPVPFAPAAMLGMDALGTHPVIATFFSDCVDGLVIWDNGVAGVAEPGIDYALFSLAPGSESLLAMGGAINDADVFFTDFTGLFALYAPAGTLGLFGDPTGGFDPRSIAFADGVDALDVVAAIPEPSTLILTLLVPLALPVLRRRR